MSKKKIDRAGVLPYYVEDEEIKILFMKPADPKYGGDTFQIAKGKHEVGETLEQTGLREGNEELGLFSGNIKNIYNLGKFLGRTQIFICEIEDPDMFGDPHHETSEVKWMTPEEFHAEGRDLHKPVVKSAVRFIEKRMLDEQANKLPGYPIFEIFDSVKDSDLNITTTPTNHSATYDVDGKRYQADLEIGNLPAAGLTFFNVSFSAVMDDGSLDQSYDQGKISTTRVLSGVLKLLQSQIPQVQPDAIIAMVNINNTPTTNSQGIKLTQDQRMQEMEKRMTHYNVFMRYVVRNSGLNFELFRENIKHQNGYATIAMSRDTTDEQRQKLFNWIEENQK